MARLGSSVLFTSFIAAAVPLQVQASGQVFLGSRDQHLGVQSHLGVSDLLAELEKAVGSDQRIATERRVARLEQALRPMFDAMPKDSEGRLASTSVRYLLHRLFVQRHGWFVNGLDSAGDSWNSSSPTAVFKAHVGDDVHSIFEDKLNSKGFTLHQVAVFAATLEHLVHIDNMERLQAAYRMLGFNHTEASLGEEDAEQAIKAYMMMFVLSMDHTVVTAEDFQEASESILTLYPTWNDTEVFAKEVRSVVLTDVQGSERSTWNSTLMVLEEVGERYGRWQDGECRDLKKLLVQMEDPGTGRVPLERFYGSALTNGSWQFLESVPYLRQLGALDDTDPERMSVIIPNYVNSPSNCVASSKFYSVCCIDECGALLGTLEDRIAAPEATPALITMMVSVLASDTVPAPRELSASLKQRLEEVAAHHGGQRIPLHSRLFAQWMHHAFPRECPYPHLSGTTNPQTALAFMKQTGEDVVVSHDEAREILNKISQVSPKSQSIDETSLPWSSEEEFFVHRHDTADTAGQKGSLLKPAPLIAALSMAVAIVNFCTVGSGVLKPSKKKADKYIV